MQDFIRRTSPSHHTDSLREKMDGETETAFLVEKTDQQSFVTALVGVVLTGRDLQCRLADIDTPSLQGSSTRRYSYSSRQRRPAVRPPERSWLSPPSPQTGASPPTLSSAEPLSNLFWQLLVWSGCPSCWSPSYRASWWGTLLWPTRGTTTWCWLTIMKTSSLAEWRGRLWPNCLDGTLNTGHFEREM